MISLEKNQKISLEKEAPALESIRMGTGWSSKKKTGLFGRMFGGGSEGIDLDASVLGYDEKGNRIEEVWYGRLRSVGITHSGDDRRGAGSGDNEVITVDLNHINPRIKKLIFTVNSFSGEKFDEIDKAFVRLVDAKTDREIARFEITESGSHTGLIMASLTRTSSGWDLQAIGRTTTGRTFHDMRELNDYAV